MRVKARSIAKIVATSVAVVFSLRVTANDANLQTLKQMSFEELMNVEITSVSRTGEVWRQAPAAVSVLDNEDIRRSGATTIPEALRMVPGIFVGRQSSNEWAVSARGFAAVSSEKMLVLSDTRSIYTPLFAGVFWDVQDYLLEDVDRVEIIRGPGATLWGSNAVNGVVNITTRSARDTHGSFLEAGAGSFERAWFGARYGGETQGGVHFRVFGKYFDRGSTDNSVVDSEDGWKMGHAGFRTDWDGAPGDSFTVQGDAYAGTIGKHTPAVEIIGRPGPQGQLDTGVTGGNLLARWRHSRGEDSDMQLRVYYDYTYRDDPSFIDSLHTFDADFQSRQALGRQEVIWGANYRLTSNDNRGRGIFAVVPSKSNDQLVGGFVQDQLELGETVRLTVGTKLEHNDFSGFEWQPGVRLAWTPRSTETLWSAVSRAVRVPTRLERDVRIDASDPNGDPVARLLGNDQFEPERLTAYEAGYRWQPLANLSLDLALFYNDYDRLASLEFGTPFIDPADGRTIYPVIDANLNRGNGRGGELQAEWAPTRSWRLTASYSHIDLEITAGGLDLNRGKFLEGATPRNQVALRSLLAIGGSCDFDAELRHVDRIREIPQIVSGEGLDGYTELDARIGWQLSREWALSLVGQNLLHAGHVEFGTPQARGEIERSGYLKAVWRR